MLKIPRDKIAVDPYHDRPVSPGGIIIPDIAKGRSDQGIVKYVGIDVKDIKPGDYVVFSGYTGTTYQDDVEGTLIILEEWGVVCIIEPSELYITGLYLKEKGGWNIDKLMKILKSYIDYDVNDSTLRTEINTFFAEHDPFFTPTYETALHLIHLAAEDAGIPARVTSKAGKNWAESHKNEAKKIYDK